MPFQFFPSIVVFGLNPQTGMCICLDTASLTG